MASTRSLLESRRNPCVFGEVTVTASRDELAGQVERYFEDLRGPVYVYVFSCCGSPERAEELTQDAFLRLYTHLRAGNTIDNVRGWVFRVAHNLAVNEGKRRRFEVPVPPDSDEWPRHSDPAPNPEQQLLKDERASRFWRSMKVLTEHQRRCMQLRAEGFQTQQIAEILEVSRGGVVDALQRAVKRLRKAMV